jgi:hypothetical protein
MDASRTSAMIFMILAAAAVFSHVLTKMRMPAGDRGAGDRPTGSAQIEFLLAVMLLILILGMFLETISIILITTPIVLPVLAALDINPIWYGVLLMINLGARADHPAGRHEPVHHQGDHQGADRRRSCAGVVPYAWCRTPPRHGTNQMLSRRGAQGQSSDHVETTEVQGTLSGRGPAGNAGAGRRRLAPLSPSCGASNSASDRSAGLD